MTIHYVNLTNGLLAVREYNLADYRVIRIQSTWCEQKLWSKIIEGLSDDFLFQVAAGHKCIVYDYGANKSVPRAIWQGLEFIKFSLHACWHHDIYFPKGRASSSLGYFHDCYRKLSAVATSKLRYYRHYAQGPINIVAVTKSTQLDGKIRQAVADD